MSRELPGYCIEYPTCGACGGATEHDGDSFYCDDCGLTFGRDESDPAEFRDEDAEVCGKACDNSWHPTLGLVCYPCMLPALHRSDCWTGCESP
ncbi:hypothetical protein SEA_LITTLETOKYO_62 [Arthrobacter phage LittleTokyo]|nr:hypothetical protein SEA_LITTLETOKYO_62 [Arthrobacter phage LittleTokyo]